jgi:hypothetical protein
LYENQTEKLIPARETPNLVIAPVALDATAKTPAAGENPSLAQ